MSSDLIYFLAVGRIATDASGKNDSHLLASLVTQKSDPEAATYVQNANKILSKASKIQTGKRIRLTSEDAFVIHVLSSEIAGVSFVFIAITPTDFQTHHSLTPFFDDWRSAFEANIGSNNVNARKGALESKTKSVLDTILAKYNSSSLRQAQFKAEKVKGVMRENVDLAISNLEGMDEMDQRSADIEASSRQFHAQTKAVKCAMCKEKWKSYLIGVGILVLIVAVILIIIFATKK